MNDNNVSLTISKEIVNPIVNAKIKEAILEALGGRDELIAKVVNSVFTQRVDASGKVSQYNSDNQFSWLDITVTNQIKGYVSEAMKEILTAKKDEIKKEMIRQLSSKKSIEHYVSTLLDSSAGVHGHYRSLINVTFENIKS